MQSTMLKNYFAIILQIWCEKRINILYHEKINEPLKYNDNEIYGYVYAAQLHDRQTVARNALSNGEFDFS